MFVIGVSGKARHGKDTVAQLIQEVGQTRGLNIMRLSMADPLKARVYAELGGEWTYEDVFHTKPPKVRETLQIVGTERGREVFGEHLWTLQAEAYLKIIEERSPFVHGVVFADIRFPNEVEFIRQGGGVLVPCGRPNTSIWIESDRPTIPAGRIPRKGVWGRVMDTVLGQKVGLHASETALDHLDKYEEFDWVLNNDRDVTIEHLTHQVEVIIDVLEVERV